MKCPFHAVEHNVTLETGSRRVFCNRDLFIGSPEKVLSVVAEASMHDLDEI